MCVYTQSLFNNCGVLRWRTVSAPGAVPCLTFASLNSSLTCTCPHATYSCTATRSHSRFTWMHTAVLLYAAQLLAESGPTPASAPAAHRGTKVCCVAPYYSICKSLAGLLEQLASWTTTATAMSQHPNGTRLAHPGMVKRNQTSLAPLLHAGAVPWALHVHSSALRQRYTVCHPPQSWRRLCC